MISLAREQLPNVRNAFVALMQAKCTSITDWRSQSTRLSAPGSVEARIEFTLIEPYKNTGALAEIKVYGNIIYLVCSRDASGGNPVRHRDKAHDDALRILYDIWNAVADGANCGDFFLQWDGQPLMIPLMQQSVGLQEAYLYEGTVPFCLTVRVPLNYQDQSHAPLGS